MQRKHQIQFNKIEPRLVYSLDRTQGIFPYDRDNCYPNRVADYIRASSTGTGCIKTFANFLNGDGFQDIKFGESKVNKKGLTVNNLLNYTTYSYAMQGGWAWLINYNALYEIASVQFVPFNFIRYKVPDENCPIEQVVLYDDWGRIKRKTIDRKLFKDYPVYNPDPKVIQEQVDSAGGWAEYEGQILYYTGLPYGEYPLAPIDPSLEDVRTDYLLKMFRNRNLETGFMPSGIITHVGQFESEDEEWDYNNTMKEFQGAEDSNKLIIETVDTVEGKTIFTPFSIQNNDKLFELTTQQTKTSIIEAFAIPHPLPPHAATAGKLGMANEIYDANMLYTALTQKERTLISNYFKDIFSKFIYPINPSNDYTIMPPQYITKEQIQSEIKIAPNA